MTLASDLLKKHGAKLDERSNSAVAEFARRQKARQDFAYPKNVDILQAQTGYVLFEREFSSAPVTLFGQDVKSLAHTRLRIFRADIGPDEEFVQGEEIFSGRISEKAVTEAMLLSNRGEGAPMTVTRLGDFELPAHQVEATKVERSAETYRSEQIIELENALSSFRKELADKPQRPNASLKEAASSIGYKIRDMLSTKFALSRHLENMSILRTEVLTEAAHAALHAQRITDALKQKPAALPAPDPLDWDKVSAQHPMVDTLLDPLPKDLKEGLRLLILEEIRELAKNTPELLNWIKRDDEVDCVVFPAQRDRSSAVGYGSDREELSKHIESLAWLSNWALNPHIAKSRGMRRATQASLGVSQRNGWLGDIHSSLPPTEGAYFCLTVTPAWDDLELGRGRTRSASERLVEFDIVAEDLMTALRGHPEGLAVPCSIRALAGVWRHAESRPRHQITADIAAFGQRIENTEEVQELRQVFSRLQDLVNAKRSGQKWRDEMQATLLDIEAALAAARISVDDGMVSARSKIDEHVVKSAEDILASISRALPTEAMKLLQLPGPENP